MATYEQQLLKMQRAYMASVKREMTRYFNRLEKAIAHGAVKGIASVPVWAANPQFSKKVNDALRTLGDELTVKIRQGCYAGWDLAEKMNDQLVTKYTRGMLVPPKIAAAMLQHNSEALEAFLFRRGAGMNLSERVWNLTESLRNQLELSLASGIADGLPARQLASQTKRYLREPDRLFRRVRNQQGKLVLSKPAKAYNPGRGVYRSSFQNALRLAATEINMAYRASDYHRRQALPFVVGVRVYLSAQHPKPDICDEMAGDYPKGFYFPGWHPRCICQTESILLKPDQFQKAIESGYVKKNKYVDRLPNRAQAYVKDKLPKIQAAGNKPYWFANNFDALGQPTKILNPVAVQLIDYAQAPTFIAQGAVPQSQPGTFTTYEDARDAGAEFFRNHPAYHVPFEYYTGDGYTIINDFLRSKGKLPEGYEFAAEYVKKIDTALATAPKYQGQLYRGFRTAEEKLIEYYLPRWQETGLYADGGYTSSSVDKAVADIFARGRRNKPASVNIYIRNSRSSVSIETVGINAEKEFLFGRSTEFRIVELRRSSQIVNNNEHTRIDMIIEEL